MNLTLLLDLDDTLLGNDMSTFLPAYLQALGAYMAERVDPELLGGKLMEATRVMMANDQPNRTLKSVFDAVFYPSIGVPEPELRPHIDRFYEEVFPELQPLTQRRPEAVALVQAAQARGHRLAVATSPVFPLPAIHHRLRWAGLPPDRYPFEVISSYERFHFSKPHTAYFAEVMAQMGWPAGPVLVVGNDPENDIAPARSLELPAFWVNGSRAQEAQDELQTSGALDEVLPWVDTRTEEELVPAFQTRPALLAILNSTPAAIDTLTGPISDGQWDEAPGPDAWNLTQILCHLRDVELEVHLPRLKRILEEESPFIPGEDTDAWAETRRYDQQSGPAARNAFLSARLDLLSRLMALESDAWARGARHTIFGPTDLQEIVKIMAAHDRLHLQQIVSTIESTGKTDL